MTAEHNHNHHNQSDHNPPWLPVSRFSAIVDRVEGDLAVIELEHLEQLILPVKYLPSRPYDGMALSFTIELNPGLEQQIKDEIEQLQQDLQD